MTKEETISNLKAYLDGDTAVGNIIPLCSVLESAIKYLSEPSLPSNLDEAAEGFMKEIDEKYELWPGLERLLKQAITFGAEWMANRNK